MTVVSLNERRKHPRISDAIALRLNGDPSVPLDPAPTHVVKMSCGGLGFIHSASVKPQSTIMLCIHLPSSGKTIHVASRVISIGEEKSRVSSSITDKQYYVQVEFMDIEQSTLELLTDHINYVLGKTGLTNRLAIPA